MRFLLADLSGAAPAQAVVLGDTVLVSPGTPSLAASPRIVACVIEGNDSGIGSGGGVGGGSPSLEDFTIRDNRSAFDGGGVYLTDFGLFAQSPCSDAGDPASDLDPDCTRADMGARACAQASVVLRNGSGANRIGFQGLTPPVVGSAWQVRVLSSGHPGATRACRRGSPRRACQPAARPVGEASADPAIVGLAVTAQGFVLGGGAELLNAPDLKLGN